MVVSDANGESLARLNHKHFVRLMKSKVAMADAMTRRLHTIVGDSAEPKKSGIEKFRNACLSDVCNA